ncbi:hypothetical protein [Streptomyces geranii]|uniref:hypothetical protein n=1 Tax=Streptomyces geranii TaxID=2058923 RepID=UPI0013003348|nr:hypothetical protein [Streptomyces geranii]
MARRVDPHAFMVIGAVTDWAAIGAAQAQQVAAEELAKQRGLQSPRVLQLRWFFDPALGYPRTPFTIWARVRKGGGTAPAAISFTPFLFGSVPALVLDAAYPEVLVDVSGGPGGSALGISGMPLAAPIVAIEPVAPGATSVRLAGPEIHVVVLPTGTTVNGVFALDSSVADDKAWQPIEIVGLPGDGTTATGTDLLAKQGLVNALTDGVSAAHDRFTRGAPFFGWDTRLEPGAAAPAWLLADPTAMIKLFQSEMLADFIDMVDNAAAADQQLRTYVRTLATPTGQTAQATFNPLRLLVIGATTDPLNSLVTGFGTAYDASFLGERAVGVTTHVETKLATNISPQVDFMVTATFVDTLGKDVERAALLLGGVSTSLSPATPAAVAAVNQGVQSPDALDGPFRPVVTVSWDATPTMLPFHLGSQALARRGVAPPSGSSALMDRRPGDVALQPIGASVSTTNPQRRTLSDASYAIDGTIATNTVRYAVATQDIFGRWSRWGNASCDAAEPSPGRATLLGPRLDTTPAPGPCPATLTVDVSWDWANRSPQTVDVVSRRYGQVWQQDPPADLSVPVMPGAFRTSSSGMLASITFAPDGSIAAVASGAGLTATLQHLSPDSTEIVVAPVTLRAPRRYRLTVTGFDLDFDVNGTWGLALWARGTEHVAPFRIGPWTSTPSVTSASDPRPPMIQSTYEAVRLASLRDAEGAHHAEPVWTPMAGSVGYRVYTAAESTFRALTGMSVAAGGMTLTQRLAALRATFQANPARRPFTRVSAETVTGTSMQVSLPRGTKDIHLFVVLGVSAGGVESDWPVATDAQCGKRFLAFAAPQTVAPGPPTLEVALAGNGQDTAFAAQVRVKTVAGARVSKVDLHRVRVADAAVSVDTMGPPVATISGSGGGFTVAATPAGDPDERTDDGREQPIGTITGLDTVTGSWKPVFYRAVAWGTDDADRGQYGVRSQASVVRQVVVPPSIPPDLSGLGFVLPVAGSANARVDFTTAAPVAPTTLGPHVLEAEVVATDAAGVSRTVDLVVARAGLDEFDTAEPGAGLSGLWRDPTAGGVTPLHLLVRRSDPAATLRVRVRLTDPLGRITERTIDIPVVPPVQSPDITNPTLTTVTGGTILAFTTSVPNTAPGVGPYRVEVTLRPTTGRVARRAENLGDIPVAQANEDIFAVATEAIPVRRTRRFLGGTSIAVGVRRAGTVTVSVVAPDGPTVSVNRRITGRVVRFP